MIMVCIYVYVCLATFDAVTWEGLSFVFWVKWEGLVEEGVASVKALELGLGVEWPVYREKKDISSKGWGHPILSFKALVKSLHLLLEQWDANI